MAGPAHARPSQPAVVIDLTSDDDDDDNQIRVANPLLNNGRRGSLQNNIGYMASNHGLLDPDEFKGSMKSQPSSKSKASGERNMSLGPPPRMLESDAGLFGGPITKESQKNRKLKVQDRSNVLNDALSQATSKYYPPILPGATIQSRQGDRLSRVGDENARMYTTALPSSSAPERYQSGSSYPVHAMAQDSGVDYATSRDFSTDSPIASVSRRADGGLLHNRAGNSQLSGDHLEYGDEEKSSVTYSRLSAQPASLKRRKFEAGDNQLQSLPTEPTALSRNKKATRKDARFPLPPHKTVITGASRVASSGLSGAAPGRSGERLDPSQAEMRSSPMRMLDSQVISHVKRAVQTHRGILPEEALDNIGTQASTPSMVTNSTKLASDELVTNLVSEPSFKQNLSENGGMLSSSFEQNLAKRSQTHINHAMRDLRGVNMSNTVETEDITMSDLPPTISDHNYASPMDAESPDSEEVFEDSHQPKKQHRKTLDSRFRDDSSPATSFSNGRADSLNLSEGADDIDANRAEASAKPARATRGTVKPSYYASRKTQASWRNSQSDGRSSSKQTAQAFQTVQVSIAMEKAANTTEETIETPLNRHQSGLTPELSLQLMLRQREVHGRAPFRLRHGQTSFKVMASNSLEDSMSQQCQWAHQSGDVVTITWTSPDTFISGALTHYDCHNMQYNRMGNLAVGSTANKTVKMVDGHRTPRPIVSLEENKENSSRAMVATQEPWRYAPVVSSAHCELNGYSFTASYDKTVKIWKITENGPSMAFQGQWDHEFLVNFVVTSKHHELVATACEAHTDAVRVYTFDEQDASRSAYDVYNANKSNNRPGDSRLAETWAYHPATMQWGRAERVARLLLVGYSPRGKSYDDDSIPEARRNTGELCCWNTTTGLQVPINAAGRSQNVFEVLWHPSQPIFLVATAPSGIFDTKKTKTQVRMFALNGIDENESFLCMKTFDCPAADVNELTIMPTSNLGGYVTASCTNGSTYVWDTMNEDQVLHILTHGDSIDNPDPNLPLEQADSGVKFAAWGRSINRFYTGSSDGVVKAWDITRPTTQALIRTVVEAQGGIACGVFDSDHTQLLIGDATGHLHLIRSPDDDDEDKTPISRLAAKRKFISHHPNPPPPETQAKPGDLNTIRHPSDSDTSIMCRNYINEGILREYPILGLENTHYRKVGQGPNYEELGYYCNELHVGGDRTRPLIPDIVRSNQWDGNTQVVSQQGTFKELLPVKSSRKRQQRNEELDLDLSQLFVSDPSAELRRDVEMSGDWTDTLEMEEKGRDFIPDE
ncbi:hypothetical protein EG329_007491 [Mollisiaceae sp. DMI_Dod_QoI]|nr:hypothetical protein EG329_007491 [Helotiales sp. DMI_Dod_QoI]